MFNIVYNYLCFKTSNSIGNACTTGTGHLNFQALASVPAPYCYQKNKINLLLSFMPGVFDISSDEGASETGSVSEPEPPAAQPKRQRKRGPRNEHRAWTFKTQIACDMFALESTDVLTVEEKTKMFREHLRTRLDHTRPPAVLACTVLVDSSRYSGPPGTVAIPITGYVQTRNTTALPLKEWIGCVWTPVPGGLCGNPEFDADMSKPAPWKVIQIFSTLALNNAGRRAKRVIPHFPCRIDQSMATRYCKLFCFFEIMARV